MPTGPQRHLPTLLLLWGCLALLGCAGITQQGHLNETDDGPEVDPYAKPPFPWQGEEVTFTVKHVGMDIELLDVSVRVGQEALADDGTSFIPIVGGAHSIALARMVARIDDTAQTFIDPRTWLPLYAYKELHENEKHRAYHVWFWPQERYASVEKHKGKHVRSSNVALPAGTLDAVSWVYHMRTMPLEAGHQEKWFVFDGWQLSRITVAVQPAEELWTPLGIYPAHRIDVHREKLDTHWPQGALSNVFADPEMTVIKERYFLGNVWLSADEQRLPLRMAVESVIGDLDLMISTYTPPSVQTAKAADAP